MTHIERSDPEPMVPARLLEDLCIAVEPAVKALKLIACARAQSAQHAIDVGLARNALESMGFDPSLWLRREHHEQY